MKSDTKHSLKLTPPPGAWHGHSHLHVKEYNEETGGRVNAEYIGMYTLDSHNPGGTSVCFIPKASILEAAMLLFEIAEREGLTEIKEDAS